MVNRLVDFFYRKEFGGSHINDGAIEEEIIAIEQIDRPYSGYDHSSSSSTSGGSSKSSSSRSNSVVQSEEAYEEVDISDRLPKSSLSSENRPSSSASHGSNESVSLPPGINFCDPGVYFEVTLLQN